MLKELYLKYRPVIFIFLIVLTLFGIRSLSGDHFRPGAEKNAEPAFSGDNILELSVENISDPKALYVNLDIDRNALSEFTGEKIDISPESLLDKESLKILKERRGRVILVSDDASVLARSWMLLAQKGVENLFVIGIDPGEEIFKYQFRPDTLRAPA